ncbi:MAG: hypothetical protein F6J94_07495 [Moorea sp. SIO1F2]|nr:MULTISPECIES: hypothetical protein [unclassified Moorena]NEN99275.1 hypothetical protein [Moorena sp. SIO3I7]NEO10088.1 hypothetical protein [Moorena sp. SIO3I8]NEO21412.1 hypothetical protein [Moorena sp. SIO4A5]NEP25755.1 hypothetical protein [Moorena sp. SIO3I6]NEQ61975.1 hypothetical protein [Moorena sp. SIO4A1]
MSYLNQDPDWTPTLGSHPGKFGIVDRISAEAEAFGHASRTLHRVA